MSQDLSAWRDLITEIESWPAKAGKYQVRFNGEPEEFDYIFTCPDCGRRRRVRGISFGAHDPGLDLASHRSKDCPAWGNRLWRYWHHGLWRLWPRLYRQLYMREKAR